MHLHTILWVCGAIIALLTAMYAPGLLWVAVGALVTLMLWAMGVVAYMDHVAQQAYEQGVREHNPRNIDRYYRGE